MNHQESFIHFLKYEKRSSSHTILAYQHDLDQFSEYCTQMEGSADVSRITRKTIRDWVIHLMDKKQTARSVRRKISALKTFFKYLMKLEIIESNPVIDIPLPKVRKKLPCFVEENSLHHLLDDGYFKEGFRGARDKMIIALLYGTGIRLNELLTLSEDHMDLDQCQIKVKGKRNKERIIPFSLSLKPQIMDYLRIKEEIFGYHSGNLIVTDKGEAAYEKFIYRVVNHYLSMVSKLDKRSPHVLRHTFATHLLNKGADLNAVKELLGHASLGATEIYTHTTFEKLHTIYQQAHPRG